MTKKDDNKEINEVKELKFNEDLYMEDKVVELKNGGVVKIKDYKDEFSKKGSVARGKLRTAKAFDVPIDHLEKVARDLNNRKIDNIFVNDLLGRHGFYNGLVMSRADLAKKSGVSTFTLEIAADKLKEIIKREDFLVAYKEYLEIVLAEQKLESKREAQGDAI